MLRRVAAAFHRQPWQEKQRPGKIHLGFSTLEDTLTVLSNHDFHLQNSTILVKLVSTALTGFFYTARRTRLAEKLAVRKYDPMGE
jgi:ribosomal protein L33